MKDKNNTEKDEEVNVQKIQVSIDPIIIPSNQEPMIISGFKVVSVSQEEADKEHQKR